jgi:hypothetical protein
MIDKRLPRSLNNSADSRIRGVDEMTDALNILVTGESSNGGADGSISGDAGVIKPINGNQVAAVVEEYFQEGFQKVVIGSVSDQKYGFVYFFVFSEDANEMGVYRVTEDLNVQRVFASPYFNFQSDGFVKADVVHLNAQNVDEPERTILYFTDNVNEPRKIDVNRVLDLDVADYDQYDILDIICACPRHPVQPPVAVFDFDNSSGFNNFKDRTGFQFAYQNVYYSGEESAISTYSAFAIPSSYITAGNTAIPNQLVENRCVINVPRDGYTREIQYIRLLTKEASSNNWFLIDEIEPQLTDAGTNYNFYNDRILTAIPEYEVSKQFDSLPKRAQAQTFSENRLFYGNYVEGFDPIQTNVDITAQYSARGQDFVNSSINIEPIIAYVGRGEDPSLNTAMRNRVVSFKIGEPNVPSVMLEGETYRLFFTVTPKENWHIYDARESFHAFSSDFVESPSDQVQADSVGVYENPAYDYDYARHSFGKSTFEKLFTVNNGDYRSQWQTLLGPEANTASSVSYGTSPSTPIIIKGGALTFDIQLRATQDVPNAAQELQSNLTLALTGQDLNPIFEFAATPKITSSYNYDLNIGHRHKIFPNSSLSSLICCAVDAGDIVAGQETAETPVGYFVVNEANISFDLRPLSNLGYNNVVALDISSIQDVVTIPVIPDVDLNNVTASGFSNPDSWVGPNLVDITKWVAIDPDFMVSFLTNGTLRGNDFPSGDSYIEDIINSEFETPETPNSASRIRKMLGYLNLLDDGKLFFGLDERNQAYNVNAFSIIDGSAGPGGTNTQGLSAQFEFDPSYSVLTHIVRYGRNFSGGSRVVPFATVDAIFSPSTDELGLPEILYTNEGEAEVRASIANVIAYQTEINQGVFNRSFKTESVHSFGIVYYDQRGRASNVMPIGSVFIDGLGSRGNFDDTGEAGVTININHNPPEWAFNYQIVYTGNNTISDFIQYTSAGAYVPEGENRIYVSLNYLQENKNSYAESFGAASPEGDNRLYQFQKGDKVRVVSAYRGDDTSREFFSDTEFEILEFVTLTTDSESNPLYEEGEDPMTQASPKVGDFVVLKDNPLAIDFSSDAVREGYDLWNNRCVIELYSNKKSQDVEDVVFYETSNVYDVVINDLGESPVLVHDVTSITTYNGDVFWRRVPVKMPTFITSALEDQFPNQEVGSFEDMVLSGNDSFNSYFLETNTFNDLIRFSDVDNFGKAKSVLPNEIEVRRTSSITYGEANNYASSLSKITSFNRAIGNFKDIPNGYGSINYIHAFNEFLICIQDSKISRIPVNRNIISDASTNQQLIATASVLGSQSFFSGDYGCDGHPESVTIVDNDVYFADLGGEQVIRFNRLEGGVSPISENGMKEFFERQFRALGNNPRIVGGYDPLHDEFLISMYDQTVVNSNNSLTPTQPTAISNDPETEPEEPAAIIAEGSFDFMFLSLTGDLAISDAAEDGAQFEGAKKIYLASDWDNTNSGVIGLSNSIFTFNGPDISSVEPGTSFKYSLEAYIPFDPGFSYIHTVLVNDDNGAIFTHGPGPNEDPIGQWFTIESPVFSYDELANSGVLNAGVQYYTPAFNTVLSAGTVIAYVRNAVLTEAQPAVSARTAPPTPTSIDLGPAVENNPSPFQNSLSGTEAGSAITIEQLKAASPKGKNPSGYKTADEVEYWFEVYNGGGQWKTLADLYNPAFTSISDSEGLPPGSKFLMKNKCLIDSFGAGNTAPYNLYSKKGVYTDPEFLRAANAFQTWQNVEKGVKSSVFDPTKTFSAQFIPTAYVTERIKVDQQGSQFNLNDNLHPNQTDNLYYEAGSLHFFGISSGRNSSNRIFNESTTLFITQGVDIFDAAIHNGVLAMVDYMTPRQYFRFKNYSVSAKFGLRQNPEYAQEWYEAAPGEQAIVHRIGEVFDYGGSVGEGQRVSATWAPCAAGYEAWTNEIVVPFFNEFMGQSVTDVMSQVVQSDQDIDSNVFMAKESLNDASGHYDFFQTMISEHNTWGPLVYDFDMDGVWTETDLLIWQALTEHWSSLGDDSGNEYTPANYYTPGKDIISSLKHINCNYAHDDDPDSYYASQYRELMEDDDSEFSHAPGLFNFLEPQINNSSEYREAMLNDIGENGILHLGSNQNEVEPNATPFFVSTKANKVFNWNYCLDQRPFAFANLPYDPNVSPAPIGVPLTTAFDYSPSPYFVRNRGTADPENNNGFSWVGPVVIDPEHNWYDAYEAALWPWRCPISPGGAGAGSLGQFANPMTYLIERPNDTFFPITKYWQ